MTESFQEISTIRNILMGQQMAEYDTRFDDVLNQLKEQANRMEEMNRQWAEQLAALSAVVAGNHAEINSRLDAVSQEERHRIGRLLRGMSDQLLGG
jgi:hypothetical protein